MATPYADEYPGVLACDGQEGGLYPNCDLSIWLRSCLKEELVPISGTRTGQLPAWLAGSLVQNGPGNFQFGDQTFGHLFDGSALLQKFNISNGEVTYQSKFIQSQRYKENKKAQRIVGQEFGTSIRDQTWLGKLKSLVSPYRMLSDNTMITVYPFMESLLTFYESPFLHKINPDSLETECRHDLLGLGMVSLASHPHFDKDGAMMTMSVKLGWTGVRYAFTKFSPSNGGDDSLSSLGTSVGSVSPRWALSPCYMHSFALTSNYILLIEQPLAISVLSLLWAVVQGKPLATCLKWAEDEPTVFHLVERSTGRKHPLTYRAKPFFFLHTINAYEENHQMVVDICGYPSPAMMDCMYLTQLQKAQSNREYASLFRGRPVRFILPLSPDGLSTKNQVNLPNKGASAKLVSESMMEVESEEICDVGCETPTIFYQKFNGAKYRYFYGINSDVDSAVPGSLVKVDVEEGTHLVWGEPDTYCSEPIFVPAPDHQHEDQGVVVASFIRGKPQVNVVGLLVLSARDLTELCRVEFHLASPVPKPLHGCFLCSWDFQQKL